MPMKPRQIRIDGDLAYIPLTQGCEAVIDMSDLALVVTANWHVRSDGPRKYAARNLPKDINGFRKHALLHRVICGAPDGCEVDHIDGNGLNNCRSNLRLCNKSENQANRKVSRLSTTGLKGVSPYKSVWRARISKNGRRYYLGYHKTPDAAHQAYCQASAEFHGQFGRVV